MNRPPDKPLFKRQYTARVKICVAAGMAVVIGAAVILATTIHTSQDFLRIQPIDGKSSVTALVESKAGTTPLSFPQSEGTRSVGDVPRIILPMRLSTKIKNPADRYQDVVFVVDSARTKLIVLADGFDPDAKASLRLDGKSLYHDIVVDWSGRIELSGTIENERSKAACLDVQQGDGRFSLCLTLPEKGAV